MVDACTGVILVNPMLEVASTIHSDSGGVSAFHLDDEADLDLDSPLSGAICGDRPDYVKRYQGFWLKVSGPELIIGHHARS